MQPMYPMIWVSTHLKTRMTGTNLGLILALVEVEGWPFNYLNNWTGLNCNEDDIKKVGEMEKTNVVFS